MSISIARELNFLHIPDEMQIEVDEIDNYPDEQILMITTGSQGEPMSALARMAGGTHKGIRVKPGDTIILSSRFIPGNERAITQIINSLYRLGAEVVYEKVSDIHTSGHAKRDELKMMLSLVKPAHFIPIHGEYRHLVKHGQLAQEMRRIKRPLVLNVQKQRSTGATDAPPANVIMVTSAVPEEGKSFIAINLAVSLAAEVDRRVLLVDADVAMRDITRDFDLEGKPGLAELLSEPGSRYEEHLLTTSVPGLSILSAGEPVDHVDELFASRRMEALIKLMAEDDPERIVLFDTSPLLRTTESTVLARRMGQVVLVVEANKTSQSAVTKAVGLLEGCANVSLLLNKASRTESSDYGYGYSYGVDLNAKV